MSGFERYSRQWGVWVENKGDGFATSIWRDTAEGAERAVRAMYPYAEVVCAEGDVGWDYETEGT